MTLRTYKILLLADPCDVEYKLTVKALQEAFAQNPECQVFINTKVSLFSGFLGFFFRFGYRFLKTFMPNLFGKFYNVTNESSHLLWLRNLLCKFVAALQEEAIKTLRPDIIISSGVIPAGVANLYKKDHPKVFLAEVIPQYSIHQWWLFERTNLYFLAGDDIKPFAEFQPWQRVFACGVPVRQEFKATYNREYLRMKFGWKKDDRICLIMDDINRPLPVEDLMTSIVNNYDATIKFIAVEGKNLNAARKLRRSPYGVKVFGYVDSPAEIMNCADYLITRARSVIAAEALTTPAKYILYSPLPGPEMANAQYLENLGAVKVAINPFEVANNIKDYDRADNIFLGAMGKPLSADYIAEVVLREKD